MISYQKIAGNINIDIDIDIDLFNIETNNMTYAFANSNYMKNIYFGSKINAEDLKSIIGTRSHSSFDNDLSREKEEYGFWDSYSFLESCLKIAYKGIRKLDMHLMGHTIEKLSDSGSGSGVERLTLNFKNGYSELYVSLVYDVYTEFDIIARYATVRNEGETVVIENLKSAAMTMPELENHRIKYLTGKWAGESKINDLHLTTGAFTIQSKRGNTGPHYNPSFALDDGTATESNGNVWFGLLGYSGNWQITFEKTIFNNVRITGGISSFDFMYTLEKGEEITTPVMYTGFSPSGFGGMSRALHAFELKHIISKSSLNRVLYNSWEATTFNVREESQRALAEKAAEMGIELFVIDDGWFGERHSDRAGLGDWYVNKDKFPNGLHGFISYVKSLGMDFGIWVEPEAVNPDSDLYRAHPDWIYRFDGQEPIQARNQYVLNISKPEVKQYIIDFMSKLLNEYKDITFIKWDMNRTLNDVSCGCTDKDKELWFKHAQTLYEIWDTLRSEFPHVEFESCSGGGGRVDLGILRYADECWASDNTDAFERLFIQEGFSCFYAPKVMMCWVTDASSHDNKKYTRPYSYRFHSSMMGALGIGADISKLTDSEVSEFKSYIDIYKSIRETVQLGSLYRLRSPRSRTISAVQYINQNKNDIVVFMFLHGKLYGDSDCSIKLEGLEPNAVYEVEGFTEPIHGATLMNIGIPSGMHGDFDSRLVKIRRKGMNEQ